MISRKKIKNLMIEAFLKRFSNGNSMCRGKMSCIKNIKKSSVITMNDAIHEWLLLETLKL
jgi:hypothetical protein